MKVIIIDDDPIVVSSLATIVQAENMEVLGKGYDGSEALELYKKHKPNVILLDIRMKEISGIQGARGILNYDPEAAILLITTFHDQEYIEATLEMGCKGYILKDNIPGLIPAIAAVSVDNIVFDSKIVQNLTKPPRKVQINADLSQREEEVLEKLAQGLNKREIAEELYLSEGTVRNYVSNLLDKLDLRDRTQLAIYYYKGK